MKRQRLEKWDLSGKWGKIKTKELQVLPKDCTNEKNVH